MKQRYRVGGTLAVALLGASAFAVLANGVSAHRTAHLDGRLRARFPRRRRPATKKVANAIGPLGKPWGHGAIALAVAVHVHQRRSSTPAAAIVLCSTLAMALSRIFETALRQREPPPGRHSPTEPSFPSGHSLETAATSAIVGYILSREELATAGVAFPAAVSVPVLSGLGRIYLDRHWATDVAGGWLAGLSLAAACAAMYEGARD